MENTKFRKPFVSSRKKYDVVIKSDIMYKQEIKIDFENLVMMVKGEKIPFTVKESQGEGQGENRLKNC